MRPALLLLVLAPGVASAQLPKADAAATDATVAYVSKLYDPPTGAFRVTPEGKPSLRASNGAVKILQALGKPLPDPAKTKTFVVNCYDANAGTFAEPGQKADVAINAVGVMVALELGVPKADIKGAMDSLGRTAQTFEEVRIAAAAVEAWGVKECPFDLAPWAKIARDYMRTQQTVPGGPAEQARAGGSVAAFYARLDLEVPNKNDFKKHLAAGQKPDGGYGPPGVSTSDLETTYRVLRALKLLDAKPAKADGVAAFVATCRNADGGYGVKPGEASSMSGVYYAVRIGAWLK